MTAGAFPLDVMLALRVDTPEIDWPALTAALSEPARQRLAPMRAVGRRHEFVLGRVLAAQLLGAAVGGDRWDLAPLPGGKPVAVAGDGREHGAISLSHSRGHVLCAVAPTGRLGCDIEALRPRSAAGWRRLANFALPHPVFALPERQWILDAADEARAARLYALWTIKEAIGKASGRGLYGGLAQFAIDVAAVAQALQAQGELRAETRAQGQLDRDEATAAVWHWQLLCSDQVMISIAADAPLAARWWARQAA